ncbi:Thermosome subunit alpha, partial [Globisporangium splendens]
MELPLHMTRDEAKQRVVRVSIELLEFAKRSYGPLGSATLLQKNAQCGDALVLTLISERYLQHVNLQLEIQEGALAQTPQQTVLRGLQLALQWSLEYIDDPKCPVRIPIDWSDRASLHAIIRGIIGTKSSVSGLAAEILQQTVIPLVLESFLAVYVYMAQYPREPMPIRFLFHPGEKSLSKSEFWKHTVFLDFPWPWGYPLKPIVNAKLALFNITIDPLQEDANGDTTMVEGGSRSNEKFSLEALRETGDTLQRLGVHAVMSQKIIPKYLQMHLTAKGIFTLDRLSISHISAVQQLSGAMVIGDWRVTNLEPSALGFLALITTQDMRGKTYIRLHRRQDDAGGNDAAIRDRATPVSTMMPTAPDKFAYDELSYSVETALKRLSVLAENPDALAGCGCTEIHLASFLREKAELLRPLPSCRKTEGQLQSQVRSMNTEASTPEIRGLRQLRQVVNAFADCMARVVTSLSHAPANDCDTIIEMLEKANSLHHASEDNGSIQASASEKMCGLYG